MSPIILAIVVLLWNATSVKAQYVRGHAASHVEIFERSIASNSSAWDVKTDSARALAVLQGRFQALTCNKMLPTSTCSKFTSKFGEHLVYSTRVKIDCGVCYWMDVSLEEVTFAKGLEVNGKLVFMDGHKITVKTTMIVVQGTLEVTSTKQVDGTPDVKFVIVGGADDQFFTPLNENKDICGGNPCGIGTRSIAVAGGQVKFNGLPMNTPSWVRLFDILTAPGPKKLLSANLYDAYRAPPSISGCPSNGVYFNEDFSLPDIAAESFGDTGLAEHSLTGTAIKIFNRQFFYKGLQVDLAKIRRCLLPDQPYIITVQVRLVKSGAASMLTTCAQSKGFCMRFFQVAGSSTGSLKTKSAWTESPIDEVKYNVPFTFTVPLTFSATEISVDQTNQLLLWLDGPGTDTDIFIEFFRFEHPPASTYPNPNAVCANLVPGNGGAEDLGSSPFPVKTSSPYVKLEVVDDPLQSGNRVFAVTDGCCGLSWNFPVACLQKRMQLRFHADILAVKDAEITVRLVIQRSGSTNVEVLAVCTLKGSSTWQTCDNSYTVPDTLVTGTEQSFLVRFDAVGNYSADNISLYVESGPPIALIVENSILNKWGPGSEIVVTSHTKNWNDYQVRTVTDVSPATKNGYVVVTLDRSINAPTTMKESPDFAVEVALLSRNIVFDAEAFDADPLIGGHFWIMYTPKVLQSIVGVEIKNFGQAGTLGRYPIHHSDDTSGSIVAKNTIRQSNQRCIIVHGTNNLLIQENVAFDTHGHCYILEDGIESGNKFIRNIGVATQKAARLIKAQIETDNTPSTFWITNPQNTWIGNVAAGSEESGFWFELQKRGERANEFPGLDPKAETVKMFQGNVAHSNAMRGVQTYKSGFLPTKQANFTGLKVFRNHFEGIFLHETINVIISDSIFADNQVSINLGLADYIVVRDTTVIGESGSYRKVMETQGAAKVCYFGPDIIGITMHTFTRTFFDDGATLQNVALKNFSSSTCKTKPLKFDGSTESGLFHWPTSAKNMLVLGGTGTVDFCSSLSNGITTAFLIDLNGGLRPSSLDTPLSASTLISNHPDMATFVDSNNCVEVARSCHRYCANTCFRSTRFFVSPAETENLSLRICQPAKKLCRNFKGYFYSDDQMGLTDSSNRRVFPAYLPKGVFTAQFIGSSGKAAWPTFVETTFDRPLCPDALSDNDITLTMPSVTTNECTQLIRNGNAEMSSNGVPYWLHKGGGVQVAVGKGRSGSNAVSDAKIDSTLDQINQHLDSRCMAHMKDRVYEIQAWVRLVKKDGSQFVCDPNTTTCPSVGIITSSGRNGIVGRVLSEGKPGTFQLMHGLVTIGDDLASETTVTFAIGRNRADVRFMVDDVSMTVMPQVSSSDAVCKSNMVLNGNFNTGDDRFWIYPGSKQRIVADGNTGNWALEFTDSRPTMLSSCFIKGASYTVGMKFKMLNGNGNPVLCGSALPCPSVYLFTEKDGVRQSSDFVAKVSGSTTATGWNQLSGKFTASATMLSGDSHTLWFSYKNGYKLLIDDVIVRAV